MRHTRWIPALIAVAAAAAMSQAAAGECLSAPKGPAAKGQHWYYHLDRTTHQKCWYQRGATAATPAASDAAPHKSADSAAAQPAPSISRTDTAAPAGTGAQAAPVSAPPETSEPQDTGSIWSDPPAPSAEAEASVPPVSAAPASSVSETPPAPAQQATPRNQAAQVAAAPETTSASSLTENLWIVALAAALAAFTVAGFALVRARRAKAVRPAPAAPAGPRFGSGGVRRSNTRWPAEAAGETPALPAIEASLIPEQVSMPLPPLDTRR